MSTVIKRYTGGDGLLSNPLTRERAREYLISMGHSPESLKPIVWPEGAVSAHRNHRGEPWQFVTVADLRRERQESAKKILARKRETAEKRIAYVWTFCVPDQAFFCGWWTYIIGCGFGEGGKYGLPNELHERILELFPMVEAGLFGPLNWKDEEKWQIAFANKYQKGLWCGRPQGKSPIWVNVRGGQIEEITGRAEWPGVERNPPQRVKNNFEFLERLRDF